MLLKILSVFLMISHTAGALSATKSDPHAPITHCYHWLNEGSKSYLSFKYTFAKSNGNELTFFTSSSTSNGSVAGPGLYCGKTPIDSYSYGDRVIRVNFVDDVVLLDELAGIKYCGTKGETSKTSSACAQKTWDVKFYSGGGVENYAWYVIQNPMAIDTWTASNDLLEEDLKINATLGDSSFKAHAEKTITLIQQDRRIMGKQTFQNFNARASIIDIILKDPAKLDSIPPLNIVARVQEDVSGRLTDIEKVDIYKKFIRRSLLSNDTELSEISQIANKDQEFQKIVSDAVMDGLKAPEKQNPLLLLGVMSKEPNYFKIVPDTIYKGLIGRILSNKDMMLVISSTNVTFDDRTKAIASAHIKSLLATPYDVTNPNTSLISTVIKHLSPTNEFSIIKKDWKKYIFPTDNGPFGLSIGSEKYFFSNSSETIVVAQCKSAVSMKGNENDNQDLSFLFNDQKYKMGDTTSLNVKDICQKIAKVVQLIVKRNLTTTQLPLYLISGRVETTPFVFVASFSDDIRTQCKEFYTTLPGKSTVDEIYTSINGKAEQRTYNSSSYYSSESTLCDALLGAVSSTILSRSEIELKMKVDAINQENITAKANSSTGYLVEGRFETMDYAFFGHTSDDIFDKCSKFYENIPSKGTVDEIYWKVASSSLEKIYNSSSFWKNSDEVCGQLKEKIMDILPTKNKIARDNLVVKWATLYANDKDISIVKGRIEKMPFAFYAQFRNDILLQCREFYDYIDRKESVDDIYIQVNSSPEKHYNNNSSFWKTKDQLCDTLISNISTLVPSKDEFLNIKKIDEIIQNSKNREQSLPGRGFRVSGNIEGREYYFFGANKEEVRTQCTDFYKLLPRQGAIDDMTAAVNNKPVRKLNNSSSYWDTPQRLCSYLISAIENDIPVSPAFESIPVTDRIAVFQRSMDLEKNNFSHASHTFKVTGVNGKYSFYFYGDNFEAIQRQCMAYEKLVPQAESVSSIKFKFQDADFKNIAYNGSTNTLCAGLMPHLELNIPTQEEVRFQLDDRSFITAFENSGEPLFGKVKLNDRIFYFHAKDLKGFKEQCLAFYPNLQLKSKPTNVLYQVNLKDPKKASLGSYSLRDNKLCKNLEDLVKQEMK